MPEAEAQALEAQAQKIEDAKVAAAKELETDYSVAIPVPDTTEADATKAAAEKAEADKLAAEKVASEKVEADNAAAKVAEGTPDKERQRLQMELSAARQKIEKLESERQTPAKAAELAAAQAEADEIAGILKDGYEVDPYADVKKLAKSDAAMRDEVKALREELAELRESTQASSVESFWAKEGEAKRAIWDKACDEATVDVTDSFEAAGIKPTEAQVAAAIQKKATRIFNERVENAAKSVAAKEEKAAPVVEKKTAPSRPSVTPGGGRVTPLPGSHIAAPSDSLETTITDYAGLIKE